MSEKALQEAFAAWLRKESLPFFRQRMDKAATGTQGWPDFTIVELGRVLLIETKFGKGRLSTAQLFCHAELAKARCRVFIIRSLTDAIELVQAWRAGEAALPDEATSNLFRFGGGIYRQDEAMRYTFIRTARPGDANLPSLNR